MTIWFSTNIPEMRAISTFNRVSTDISEIQHRITTGQRINSGKDDPGGLIIREGLRADIKNINATQAGMTQAEIMMDTAASGMMQLLEILRGDPSDPNKNGLIGAMNSSLTEAQKEEAANDYLALYDAAVATTLYNGEKLIGTGGGLTKTYQLGDGVGELEVQLSDFTKSGMGSSLEAAVATFDSQGVLAAAIELQEAISKAAGALGMKQQVAAQNQTLLDSRLTSVTAAEGRISNADIAVESSRMARAELLAQNAMSSIMYTRSYAAFAVSSLFR
jgi:flagellin